MAADWCGSDPVAMHHHFSSRPGDGVACWAGGWIVQMHEMATNDEK
jgi:hypothetical protein